MRFILFFLCTYFCAFSQARNLNYSVVKADSALYINTSGASSKDTQNNDYIGSLDRLYRFAEFGNQNDIYAYDDLQGAVALYKTTHDKKYLNSIIRIYRELISNATISSSLPQGCGACYNDSFLGWHGDNITNLSGVNQGEGQFVLNEGRGFVHLADILDYMRGVNGLMSESNTISGNTYQTDYDFLLDFLQTNVWDKWHTRSNNIMKYSGIGSTANWAKIDLHLWRITGLPKYKILYNALYYNIARNDGTTNGMKDVIVQNRSLSTAVEWPMNLNYSTYQGRSIVDHGHAAPMVKLMVTANRLGESEYTNVLIDSVVNTVPVFWSAAMDLTGDIKYWIDGQSGGTTGNTRDGRNFMPEGFMALGSYSEPLQVRYENISQQTRDYFQENKTLGTHWAETAYSRAILNNELPSEIITKPTVYLNELRAFPDLEGEGANTITGGRNGVKYFITSLSNANTTPTFVPASGSVEAHYTGTYQGAMYLQQDRHIIPRVSGRVDLTSGVFPNSSTGNMSWHGHLAPEGGFLVTGDRLFPSFDNIVMRYYRHKIGNDAVTSQDDPIEFQNIDKLAFDHGSTGWGGDESLSIWNSNTGTYDEIIVQNSLIHQSRDGHNTGSIVGFTNGGSGRNTSISWHKNVYSGVTHRTPNFAGDTGSEGRIYNNIVYDWIFRLSNIVGAPKADISYNYYKTGVTNPATLASGELNKIQDIGGDRPSPPVIRSVGNIVPGILDDPLANNEVIWFNFASTTQASSSYFTSTPLSIDPVVGYEPVSAQEAYDEIFPTRDVGANRSASATGVPIIAHDAIDTYYLDAVENNTTAYLSESNWTHPTIASNSFYTDTNWNGIYDGFETEHGITASTDVIATYDFGTYQVINTAGYDAFEIFSAYMAGDFDRMEKVDVTISLGATLTRRKKQAKEYQSIILTQD